MTKKILTVFFLRHSVVSQTRLILQSITVATGALKDV